MNIKILLKAMSFMFMPTLAILLVLLVGFFDPYKMWEFIKSDNGWAITVRVVLFIVELTFVIIMYFHYLRKDIFENTKDNMRNSRGIGGHLVMREIWNNNGRVDYILHDTGCENLKIIEVKPRD